MENFFPKKYLFSKIVDQIFLHSLEVHSKKLVKHFSRHFLNACYKALKV